MPSGQSGWPSQVAVTSQMGIARSTQPRGRSIRCASEPMPSASRDNGTAQAHSEPKPSRPMTFSAEPRYPPGLPSGNHWSRFLPVRMPVHGPGSPVRDNPP